MDDYPDQLLNKVRYYSHMYWKGKMDADQALLVFNELDDWLNHGGCGPADWEGML